MSPLFWNGWSVKPMSVVWSPLLSPIPFAALAFFITATVIAMLIKRQRGGFMRAVAAITMMTAIANPSLQFENRIKLADILMLVIDHSGSQRLANRQAQTEATIASIKQKLADHPNLDIRTVEIGDTRDDGTLAFHALQHAIADIPPDRIAGALIVTDGLIDDVPKNVDALGFHAPLHALITGYDGERDRRIELLDTPQFGIVGKEQIIRLRVSDPGSDVPLPVTLRRDGEKIATLVAPPGQIISVPVSITHGGPNLVEVEAEPAPGELTVLNNKAVLSIDGIRDRLKVLLVSGVPHPGERIWRDTLKSDANVDLVHFTILRPPEKQDATPVNELSLIAFPTRELFETKIADFDLIIFDRYADLAILPPAYFGNIVRYVRNGGALLIEAGPEFAGSESLAETPLRALLPAFPDGEIMEHPFLPHLTSDGRKHPVTRDLSGAMNDPPQWGEWTRQISVGSISGSALMSGNGDKPLLILRHENKGRVALLLSDHAWLWSRNFRGGGPYLDLLRRLGHWLMKEPQLDEEALRATVTGSHLLIERQTMADKATPVTLTNPQGQSETVTLTLTKPGLWSADLQPQSLGLYRVNDGDLTAFANLGPANPREFQTVISTPERLRPLAEETEGSVRRLARSKDGTLIIPSIMFRTGDGRFSGSDFIAFKDTESTALVGMSLWPVFTGWIGFIILVMALLISWIGEGRGFRQPSGS
jgi:hypothetical protein